MEFSKFMSEWGILSYDSSKTTDSFTHQPKQLSKIIIKNYICNNWKKEEEKKANTKLQMQKGTERRS